MQWVVAAPFIHGFLGGETSLDVYWAYAKYTGGDQQVSHQHGILWTFLDAETYSDERLWTGMKVAIVVLNIYHFFIRKRAFFTCMEHLKILLDDNDFTQKAVKKTKPKSS